MSTPYAERRRSPGKAWRAMLLLLLAMLAACGPANSTPVASPAGTGALGQILDAGVLVIATDANFAPQSELIRGATRRADTRCAANQYTANQFTGLDVDVAREIARRLGVEPCFVTPPWPQIVGGSWGDHWDVSVGSMVITPDRMKLLYFAQPYTAGSAVVFVYKDNHTFTQPSDLSGKRIGVCAGCAYEAYLNHTLQIPGEQISFVINDAQIIGYNTDESALDALAAGDGAKLDAAITDPDTGHTAIISDGLPIKQLGDPLYHDYVAPALDKKSSHDPLPLLAELNEIVRQMHEDGTLARLSILYYKRDDTQPAREFNIETLNQAP